MLRKESMIQLSVFMTDILHMNIRTFDKKVSSYTRIGML